MNPQSGIQKKESSLALLQAPEMEELIIYTHIMKSEMSEI
jgi:hypothetical protein